MVSVANIRRKSYKCNFPEKFKLILSLLQVLYVDGVLHLETLEL